MTPILLAAAATLFAAALPAAAAPAPIRVTTGGIVADVYLPAGAAARHPAILVLGGSEGGLEGSGGEARVLAERGYVTMALAYFAAPGLPDTLTNIPLDYFKTAIGVLRAQPGVDPARIGLIGTSKGGEAALLVASRNPEIRVVVAGVPSSVAWQGINPGNYADPSGSWTEGGKPVVFLPYDFSAPFKGVHDLYDRSLTRLADHPDAAIPVERIAGPIMLVCGEADALWPSCPMSEAVAARLKGAGFRHEVQLLRYADAGHAAFGPPLSAADPHKDQLLMLGGTVPGNVAARADGWTRATAFLDAALKP